MKLATLLRFLRGASVASLGAIALLASPSFAGPNETQFLQSLSGQWLGQGRAATSQGETPVQCSVDSRLSNGGRLSLRANCEAQGRSGNIGMSLYFSDMTRQFHGELSSPLNYISGGLNGRLSRGDLFLRLSADDGSEGRLLLVAEGQQLRLLVTTVVDGASITVFDLPLSRAG
ncbi:MAG: hypothetical protein AB8B88_10440 [Devosiaceae bacterium]